MPWSDIDTVDGHGRLSHLVAPATFNDKVRERVPAYARDQVWLAALSGRRALVAANQNADRWAFGMAKAVAPIRRCRPTTRLKMWPSRMATPFRTCRSSKPSAAAGSSRDDSQLIDGCLCRPTFLADVAESPRRDYSRVTVGGGSPRSGPRCIPTNSEFRRPVDLLGGRPHTVGSMARHRTHRRTHLRHRSSSANGPLSPVMGKWQVHVYEARLAGVITMGAEMKVLWLR